MRKILLVVLCAVCIACGSKQESAESRFVGTDVTGATFGEGFRLTDHHGQVRELSDFHGKLVALFFGYTHCPDVCPTTMDDLAKALKLLGNRRSQVQVLFVTLDPERDSGEVLAKYVPSFDQSFIGLRGDPATIERTAKSFKVFYQKQDFGSRSGYTIDHSGGVYVFDKKGTLRLFLSHGQKPQDIAHDLALIL
jgi:protein SCO1/2